MPMSWAQPRSSSPERPRKIILIFPISPHGFAIAPCPWLKETPEQPRREDLLPEFPLGPTDSTWCRRTGKPAFFPKVSPLAEAWDPGKRPPTAEAGNNPCRTPKVSCPSTRDPLVEQPAKFYRLHSGKAGNIRAGPRKFPGRSTRDPLVEQPAKFHILHSGCPPGMAAAGVAQTPPGPDGGLAPVRRSGSGEGAGLVATGTAPDPHRLCEGPGTPASGRLVGSSRADGTGSAGVSPAPVDHGSAIGGQRAPSC